MIRAALGGALLAAAASLCSMTAGAQDGSAARILERARALRPDGKELGLFRLDWADSVDEAVRRAGREGRPVVCVVNHAESGDLKNGHC